MSVRPAHWASDRWNLLTWRESLLHIVPDYCIRLLLSSPVKSQLGNLAYLLFYFSVLFSCNYCTNVVGLTVMNSSSHVGQRKLEWYSRILYDSLTIGIIPSASKNPWHIILICSTVLWPLFSGKNHATSPLPLLLIAPPQNTPWSMCLCLVHPRQLLCKCSTNIHLQLW